MFVPEDETQKYESKLFSNLVLPDQLGHPGQAAQIRIMNVPIGKTKVQPQRSDTSHHSFPAITPINEDNAHCLVECGFVNFNVNR